MISAIDNIDASDLSLISGMLLLLPKFLSVLVDRSARNSGYNVVEINGEKRILPEPFVVPTDECKEVYTDSFYDIDKVTKYPGVILIAMAIYGYRHSRLRV